ncbi:MAG: Gfo/Idh/MocA family oxidoreductase [Kiritimatiellae bacterium]|nr:Gfo/Idh/MocA family oxidoreductase [Kiritimatiellia bacterium]
MFSRRGFLGGSSALFASSAIASVRKEHKKQGDFDDMYPGELNERAWTAFSDKKVRVGIAGEGVCDFGSQFAYQNHPNVEVVAVTDLDPKKCKLLQERTRAKKTYPSCEEMIKNASSDKLDAVYIATDAPSHAPLAIMALEHGLHVASAVPAVLGIEQLELVPKLIDAAKASGKVYHMNETTAFRESCYAMRKLYEAGELGDIVYTEGEYFHCSGLNDGLGVGSYKGWRDCLPPLYYSTHSTGYYTFTTHKRFTEVTCIGRPSALKAYSRPNRYNNKFGSEFALFKTEEGGSARMLVAYDVLARNGERGRVLGTKGSYDDFSMSFLGDKEALNRVPWRKDKLPPGMPAGGHGGSHGYLTDDFIRAILLKDHRHCCDLKTSLETTVAGIYAHMSAVKDGETIKIPEITI